MKLKKIASLMLAGIMAVSMLAGCGEASSNSTETPDVTPVTGVAATVNGELNANKDKISFTDDKVVTDLLTNYFKGLPGANALRGRLMDLRTLDDLRTAIAAFRD